MQVPWCVCWLPMTRVDLSLISTKQSSAVIPGLSDSDVERMSLEQQCDAVLSVVTTALTDTLGGGTTQDDADQDGAGTRRQCMKTRATQYNTYIAAQPAWSVTYLLSVLEMRSARNMCGA